MTDFKTRIGIRVLSLITLCIYVLFSNASLMASANDDTIYSSVDDDFESIIDSHSDDKDKTIAKEYYPNIEGGWWFNSEEKNIYSLTKDSKNAAQNLKILEEYYANARSKYQNHGVVHGNWGLALKYDDLHCGTIHYKVQEHIG